MGLKEKQLIASRDFGCAEKRIKETLGKDLKFEVMADTFKDEDSILYIESAGSNRIANAIAKVCYNDIGKEAFNEKNVSKIVIKNEEPGSKSSLSVKDGVLTVAMAFSNSNDRMSEDEMTTALENLL